MATCLAALVHTFPQLQQCPSTSKAAPVAAAMVLSQVSQLAKSTHLQNGSWASGLRRGQGTGLSKAGEHQGKAQVSDGT